MERGQGQHDKVDTNGGYWQEEGRDCRASRAPGRAADRLSKLPAHRCPKHTIGHHLPTVPLRNRQGDMNQYWRCLSAPPARRVHSLLESKDDGSRSPRRDPRAELAREKERQRFHILAMIDRYALVEWRQLSRLPLHRRHSAHLEGLPRFSSAYLCISHASVICMDTAWSRVISPRVTHQISEAG